MQIQAYRGGIGTATFVLIYSYVFVCALEWCCVQPLKLLLPMRVVVLAGLIWIVLRIVVRSVKVKALVLAVMSLFMHASPAQTAGTTAATGTNATAGTNISVRQPQYGFNVIPGSTRRLFATVTNGKTNEVKWTLKSGTATLSGSSGPWVDVVAGASGSPCRFVGSGVSSGTRFVVEATAVDDPAKTADVAFNVCNPSVEVSVVPFYRTLYADQRADVQSLVLGSVNDAVQWKIVSQPANGDGKLNDSDKRDTVFNASVKGRYKLVATSVADPKKSASAIMFVTGNKMPYPITRNLTEPVDCTVDPQSTGRVYEVGPSQQYKTLASVPFPKMGPGSTVRLHNEDSTGKAPTEYHEYVQISQPATENQPFRMCGVPDAAGNEPIIDGANATGRSDTSTYAAGYGLVTLHNAGFWAYWPQYSSAAYIAVEGIHFRNAKTGFNYTAPNGSAAKWNDASAAIRINQGHNTAFVGNDIDDCGDGVFSAWNGNGGWGSSDFNVLWEGNHIHGNGAVRSFLSHQMYLQAWGEVVQFNRIEDYQRGAYGSNLKSRGIQTIIRYNYFGDGPARQVDLVDVQDAPAYMSFAGIMSVRAVDPKEQYPADLVAAEQEAWHAHFMYGNVFENGTAEVPIHFSMDHDGGEQARKGPLYFYSNSFHEKVCPECSGQRWTLFDQTAGGGTNLEQVEFQNLQIFNNIIALDDPTRPVFEWNNAASVIATGGGNLITAGWGSNKMTGHSGDGWGGTDAYHNDPYDYQGTVPMRSHLTGFDGADLRTAPKITFDPVTYVPNVKQAATSKVPGAIQAMPTRFSCSLTAFLVPRSATPLVGAVDANVGGASSVATKTDVGRGGK